MDKEHIYERSCEAMVSNFQGWANEATQKVMEEFDWVDIVMSFRENAAAIQEGMEEVVHNRREDLVPLLKDVDWQQVTDAVLFGIFPSDYSYDETS